IRRIYQPSSVRRCQLLPVVLENAVQKEPIYPIRGNRLLPPANFYSPLLYPAAFQRKFPSLLFPFLSLYSSSKAFLIYSQKGFLQFLLCLLIFFFMRWSVVPFQYICHIADTFSFYGMCKHQTGLSGRLRKMLEDAL